MFIAICGQFYLNHSIYLFPIFQNGRSPLWRRSPLHNRLRPRPGSMVNLLTSRNQNCSFKKEVRPKLCAMGQLTSCLLDAVSSSASVGGSPAEVWLAVGMDGGPGSSSHGRCPLA